MTAMIQAPPQPASTESCDSAAPALPETPADAQIEVERLDGFYGQAQALHGLSLSIARNQTTAFIGPSGCGKSTLLRWINRMNDLIPAARATGQVRIDGQDILAHGTDVVELRRRVGIVFQKPNPFPKSVYDNVAFGPRLHYRLSRSETDALVERSLRGAALWEEVKDRLKDSAFGLSGGQQQRLCIARAIAVEPQVLLMDEPCSALDPKSTVAIEDLMAELKQRYTIAIVTHNMQQAARASDYTGFLYEGRLVEFGPTQRVFSSPTQTRTEDYIAGRFG
ncbi:MAG: phosphate ABC transporter ATP-binding protein PstB [Planctomycetota bacterium]